MDLLTSQYSNHSWRDALLARCIALPPVTIAVVHPWEAHARAAAADAAAQGLVTLILVGQRRKSTRRQKPRNWISPPTGSMTFRTAMPLPTAGSPSCGRVRRGPRPWPEHLPGSGVRPLSCGHPQGAAPGARGWWCAACRSALPTRAPPQPVCGPNVSPGAGFGTFHSGTVPGDIGASGHG